MSKKKFLVVLAAISLATTTSVNGTTFAFAEAVEADFNSTVSRVAPESLENLTLVESYTGNDGNSTTRVDEIEIKLPASSGTPIQYTNDNGFEISIELPLTGVEADAVIDSGSHVTYSDSYSVTAPLIKEDGSVAITTVISSFSAPTRFRYPVEMPKGSYLVLLSDGSIEIKDYKNETQAMVAAPWAVDASGNEVETTFSIVGSEIIQTVQHRTKGLAYPIVFDPWFGQYLISKIVWDNSAAALAAYGPTLKVYPTEFGRYTGILARDAAWDEVLKLAGSRANKQNLVDQFMCHWDYVRVSDPRKVSWNLDSARPNVGFWPTVWAKCNPV